MLIYLLLFCTNLLMIIITIFLLVSEKKQYVPCGTLSSKYEKNFNFEYSLLPNRVDRVILDYSKKFSFQYPEGEQIFWLIIKNSNGTILKTKSYSEADRFQALFDFGKISTTISKKEVSWNEKTKIFLRP